MKILPDWLKNGYLKVIDPVANWLVRRGVHPNTITVIGTLCTVAGGVIYAMGHISTGGWFLGCDGAVRRPRRDGRAPLEQELDVRRVSRFDARPRRRRCVLAGLAVFYALNPVHHNVPMVVGVSAGLIGAYLTSYIRARAEALGMDAKVGMLQRPERFVLLSAPQAFFGLALDGWVLGVIIVFLTVTAWITVVQRMHFVYRQTTARGDAPPIALPTEKTFWLRRRGKTGTRH